MLKLLLITIFLIPGVATASPKAGDKVPVYDPAQKLFMCTVLKTPEEYNDVSMNHYKVMCPDYGDFGDEEVFLEPNVLKAYQKRHASGRTITAEQAHKEMTKRVYQQRVQALKDIKQFVKDAE